jgi:hypothetical protein
MRNKDFYCNKKHERVFGSHIYKIFHWAFSTWIACPSFSFFLLVFLKGAVYLDFELLCLFGSLLPRSINFMSFTSNSCVCFFEFSLITISSVFCMSVRKVFAWLKKPIYLFSNLFGVFGGSFSWSIHILYLNINSCVGWFKLSLFLFQPYPPLIFL